MLEFESSLDKGTSRKRYFRGTTVSQLGYNIEAVLKEEVPDKVIPYSTKQAHGLIIEFWTFGIF